MEVTCLLENTYREYCFIASSPAVVLCHDVVSIKLGVASGWWTTEASSFSGEANLL